MTITELYSNVLSGIPSAATTVAMCLVGAVSLWGYDVSLGLCHSHTCPHWGTGTTTTQPTHRT